MLFLTTPVEEATTESEGLCPTYAWSPEPADCERCGEPTTRRWRDGDLSVCPDCKPWT